MGVPLNIKMFPWIILHKWSGWLNIKWPLWLVYTMTSIATNSLDVRTGLIFIYIVHISCGQWPP